MRLARYFLLLLWAGSAVAQSADEGSALFESRIRPLFAAHCYACHGSAMQMAGLNLSTAAGFFRGRDTGPIVVKGDPEHSALIRAVSYTGTIKMPPGGKLSPQQIADLTAWVKMGAPWPQAETAPAQAPRPQFWSFQPVKDYPPPQVRDRTWVQSPIDAFILAKLEEKGIRPSPRADKLTLLRRATFDLTGLPPTQREIADFLADDSPQAFARVVDRLLASPRYGERWGRHWLDVARYADSTGADEDHRYPYAWRYRDYVIDAFNRDLPYDQFIQEQIAGDLLPARADEVNVEGITATGFLALGPKLIAEQDKVKMLYDIVDEQIDVVGRGLMGLTLACARCHDHKFDPITTKDYYSLASIFASTKQLAKVEGVVSELYFVPLVPKDEAARYQAHLDRINAKKEAIEEIVEQEGRRNADRLRPHLAEYMTAARKIYAGGAKTEEMARAQGLDERVLGKWVEYLKPNMEVRPHLANWYKATPATLAQVAQQYQADFDARIRDWEGRMDKWRREAAEARASGKKAPEKPKFVAGDDRFFAEVRFGKGPFAPPEKDEERQKVFPAEANARIAVLQQEMDALKKSGPPEPPMACAVTEGEPVEQHVFVRGNWAVKGDAVPKRFPVVLTGAGQPPITHGSGRLELARWLASPEHPLTARVMVNRIWQWHFGEGLVRTPSNFGRLGEAPTHPELLDFLAKRFIESGWSIKAMHRLLMLSSAYQMSPEISAEQVKADAANLLLSHFNRRRLDIEEIRDTLLALDGSLDLTMHGSLQEGKGTDVEFSEARMSFNPDKSRRRTVYLPLRRSNLPSVLNLFDFGDATTTSEGRSRTNIAPQALFMMNSGFVTERTRGLAKMLLVEGGDDAARIRRAYLITLGRKPLAEGSDDEVREALEYIRGFEKKRPGPEARLDAWESFCRVLTASNDFVYVN
ncbi:MAG TPA: DUF1549 domain-containing protein [Bryobacteraceae bacterium]|nr:DUF1549 domain-containing protein [Bryobacteraceae bacterium]